MSCSSGPDKTDEEDTAFSLIDPIPMRPPKNIKYQSGYDCEFVLTPPSLVQYECTICLLIFRQPYLVSCCGHNYCKGCVTQIMDAKQACPLCKSESFTILHNKDLQRCLAQLEVKCSHHKLGCLWMGKFAVYDRHLNEGPKEEEQLVGCKYVELPCSYECENWFYRGAIQVHQEVCPQRPFSCGYCQEYRSIYADVTSQHWLVCKHYPVLCPNQCMAHTIERHHLAEHLKLKCPLSLIECEFRSAGCEVIVIREEMSDHLAKWHVQHTSMLAAANQKLVNGFVGKAEPVTEYKENEVTMEKGEAQRQMDNLWVENSLLKQKITQMQVDMDELREEMCSFTNERSKVQAEGKEERRTRQRLEGEISELRSFIDLSRAALSQQCYTIQAALGIFPVEFVMTDFSHRVEMKEEWRGTPFYSHLQGYRLQLVIYPSEVGAAHLAVHASLVHGDYDDKLQWPFRGEITVQLRNFLMDRHHATGVIKFTELTPRQFTSRVERLKENEKECVREGWGLRRFILHSELHYNGVKNRQYLKDDKLCFRVIKVHV